MGPAHVRQGRGRVPGPAVLEPREADGRREEHMAPREGGCRTGARVVNFFPTGVSEHALNRVGPLLTALASFLDPKAGLGPPLDCSRCWLCVRG